MRSEEDVEKKRDKLKEKLDSKQNFTTYERKKICPNCGNKMIYIYGEIFECTVCKCQTLSDFGLVRKYLEDNGPRSAGVISNATGVPVDVIRHYLREGRVEIPDGSEQYIKCIKCGADIRYGRYCPECTQKMSNAIAGGWIADAGERPTMKKSMDGKMHILGDEKLRRKKKS